MSNDGDGDGGLKVPVLPIAEVINLVDNFATDCQVEYRGEYTRLIFSTEPALSAKPEETEAIPVTRMVMTPSGFMRLAEAILALYVKMKRGN